MPSILDRIFPNTSASASSAASVTGRPSTPPGINFYGHGVSTLKLFGQRRWGDCSPGFVDGTKVYHAAGVLVDREGHVYVADTGNNRILGFRTFEDAQPSVILGQPDAFSSAANGDCNIGLYGPAGANTLCLINFPAGTNVAEQWMFLGFDVDAAGNVYVPDVYNNRVLMYLAPFAINSGGGGANGVADMVWGQDDFAANQPNRGMGATTRDARSLNFTVGGMDHASSRGVSVDPSGNLWVADTFNFRVLRFPRGSRTADLVIGQPDFTTSAPNQDITRSPLNRTCHATQARIDPLSGELWVVDEYPGGFPARLLVFTPPFTSGMLASRCVIPRQQLRGDYTAGYRFTLATGLAMNPIKTDDFVDGSQTRRYCDGVVWVHDGGVGRRTLLLDKDGEILVAIGAPDLVSHGFTDQILARSGVNEAQSFAMRWPGGNIGFDGHGHMLLADGTHHRVARYGLPWRPPTYAQGPGIPADSGGMLQGSAPNNIGPDRFHPDRVGLRAVNNQLIVRDHQRYLVWNDYMSKPDGSPANAFVGQDNGGSLTQHNHLMGRAMHAVDGKNRLWTTGEHGRLLVYQLPLTQGSQPLRTMIDLFWADDQAQPMSYRADQCVAYDPKLNHLWVMDSQSFRLLRVRNPDEWKGKLVVDCVIGQANKTDGGMNRGLAKPSAASFGSANDLKFDHLGNLFVVDCTYEGHPNGRVIAFTAEDLAAINTMFPGVLARYVYCVDSMDCTDICRINLPVDHPHSPVSVAFNSRNEMVIGNDGYYRDAKKRSQMQVYLYRSPLTKYTPDATIALPLGAPGELCFDDKDNLIVQDHTWNKVWIINLDLDPGWLQPV